jgi:hypothetical protein
MLKYLEYTKANINDNFIYDLNIYGKIEKESKFKEDLNFKDKDNNEINNNNNNDNNDNDNDNQR